MCAEKRLMLKLFLYIFVSSQVFGLSGMVYAEESNNAAFRDAYSAYQEAAQSGNKSEIVNLARRVYALGKKSFDEDSKSLAVLQYNLANALYQQGEASEAEEKYREALKNYQRIEGEFSEEVVSLFMDLARVQLIHKNGTPQQRYNQTEKNINKALEIIEKIHGQQSIEYGELQMAAANLLIAFQLNADHSRSYVEKARDTFVSVAGADSIHVGVANYNLARQYLWGNRKDYQNKSSLIKAHEYLEQALSGFPENRPELYEWRVQTFESLQWIAGLMEDKQALTQWCKLSTKVDFNGESSNSGRSNGYEVSPLIRVAARYPLEAARSRMEGDVVVKFQIGLFGRPINLEVVGGENSEIFGAAAINSVKGWRYKPTCGNNGPIESPEMRSKLVFNLAN